MPISGPAATWDAVFRAVARTASSYELRGDERLFGIQV